MREKLQAAAEAVSEKSAEFGPTEIMFLIGIVLLFIGLLILWGLGGSFCVCGGVLIVSAQINAWQRHQNEAQNVI